MPLLQVDNQSIEITYKKIKHAYLRVCPLSGAVRVSAPRAMPQTKVQTFVLAHWEWVMRRLQAVKHQQVVPELAYLEGEMHSVRGRCYPLRVIESTVKATAVFDEHEVRLYVRSGSDRRQRERVLNAGYRVQLKQWIAHLIAHYEPIMQVQVVEFGVKRMKTKWGTCNPRAMRIWLNLELAKKLPLCLEYVVVHEMAHLLEASHNARFVSLMDQFLPTWRLAKEQINCG